MWHVDVHYFYIVVLILTMMNWMWERCNRSKYTQWPCLGALSYPEHYNDTMPLLNPGFDTLPGGGHSDAQ